LVIIGDEEQARELRQALNDVGWTLVTHPLLDCKDSIYGPQRTFTPEEVDLIANSDCVLAVVLSSDVTAEAARQAAFPTSQAYYVVDLTKWEVVSCIGDDVRRASLPAREDKQLFDAYFLVHFDRFLRAVDSQQPAEDVLLNDSIHVEPFLTAWYLWGRDLPELDERTIHLLDSLAVFLRAASIQSAPRSLLSRCLAYAKGRLEVIHDEATKVVGKGVGVAALAGLTYGSAKVANTIDSLIELADRAIEAFRVSGTPDT
jgi:hypothetical protein